MKYLLVFALLALTSCAGGPLSAEQKSEFDGYAVASMLGDRLPVQFIGTTIFQNKDGGAEIAGWKVDAQVQKLIRKHMSSIGKREISADINPKTLQEKIAAGDTIAKRLLHELDKEWQDYVFGQAQKAGARYLFIVKGLNHDNFPLHPPGYGLHCRSTFASAGDMQAYLLFNLSLWQVEGRKLLFSYVADPADNSVLTGKPCEHFSKMSKPEVLAIGRPLIERLMEDSIQQALTKAGFLEK